MSQPSKKTSRRKFLSTSAAAVATGAVVSNQALPVLGYHNGVNDKLKIGLVGCGGRGTGAIVNAIKADSNSEVTAVADAFQDRIDVCLEGLGRNKHVAGRINIPKERQFTGFDCCKNLVETDVDVVLLATPPYFRPSQLKLAVEANKHVFCEKPVGVDPPGVNSVLESCALAAKKGLSVVSGLCWRYDHGVNAVIEQIQDGAIGEIKTMQENYLTGTLWHRGENPDWSQMEYQMRNWLYFNWLSGDHIAEQHIHSLDKAMWLMGDTPPVSAYGSGGRLVRTNEKYGNVYDHFSTVYEWENGVKMFSYCRQMADCFSNVDDYIIGTKGSARILKNEIKNGDETIFKYKKKRGDSGMYDVEHQHLFRSIREGKPINNGDYMCKSTLLALLGREVSYSGKKIKWDDFVNAKFTLGPDNWEFGDYTPEPVAKPGTYKW